MVHAANMCIKKNTVLVNSLQFSSFCCYLYTGRYQKKKCLRVHALKLNTLFTHLLFLYMYYNKPISKIWQIMWNEPLSKSPFMDASFI